MRVLLVLLSLVSAVGNDLIGDSAPKDNLLIPVYAAVSETRLPDSCPTCEDAPAAYRDAYNAALRSGKPMIVWVGGNFCERCVNDSKNEFVHHFVDDGWEGVKGPATVVAVPHGDKLYRAGTVNRWTVGSSDWGHVPSARRVTSEWRGRAAAGRLEPLQLLHMSGGEWGMSHDMFWSNYRGGSYSPSRRSAPAARRVSLGGSSGGSC